MRIDPSASDIEIFFSKKYNTDLDHLIHACSFKISDMRSFNMKNDNPHLTDWKNAFKVHQKLISFINEMKLVPNYRSFEVYKRARLDLIRTHRRISLHRLVDRKFAAKAKGATVQDRNKQYFDSIKDAREQEVAEFLYCMQKANAGHMLHAEVVTILANALGNFDWMTLKNSNFEFLYS
jgi:hypothetical protein